MTVGRLGVKRLILDLPDELVEDLEEIARRRKRTVERLILRAVERVYGDALDVLVMERELAAHLADPAGSMTLEEYIATRQEPPEPDRR